MTDLTPADLDRLTTPTAARRTTGALRLAAASVLLFALIFQIVDKVSNNDMVLDQYFAFFTIQSTMIITAVLAWGGWSGWTRADDSVRYTIARLSIFAYAVIMAVVYNLLLRGIPDEGYVVIPWPGEIMHVWMPLFIVLDWFFAPGRPALRWQALWVVIAYPLAWVAASLIRGAATGWFPYPFLEFSTGALSVAMYIVAIAAFIVGVAAAGIALSRRRAVEVI